MWPRLLIAYRDGIAAAAAAARGGVARARARGRRGREARARAPDPDRAVRRRLGRVRRCGADLRRHHDRHEADADAALGARATSWCATSRPGLNGERFERELARRGYTFGHFPSSIYCSTVGGWLATRAAGQLSTKYGKVEDRVAGLTVVTGRGEVDRDRRPDARAARPELDAADLRQRGHARRDHVGAVARRAGAAARACFAATRSTTSRPASRRSGASCRRGCGPRSSGSTTSSTR